MNKVVVKKGDKLIIGSAVSLFNLLGLKTPETIRRWVRDKKTTEKNGYEVFTDVEDTTSKKILPNE